MSSLGIQRAVRLDGFGGPEVLTFGGFEMPSRLDGMSIVRVRACGVNRLDIMIREGKLKGIALPHVPGSEIAGTVVEVGTSHVVPVGARVVVAPWVFCGMCEICLAGDETICPNGYIIGVKSRGGYAQYVAVPTANLVALPEPLTFSDGAALTLSALTAWRMLVTKGGISAGQKVLIHGGGSGIGSIAIQIAKLFGATAIATARPERRDRTIEIGADHVVTADPSKMIDEIRRVAPRGVDIVFEHVGSSTWDASVAVVAAAGKIVTCGATTGRDVKLDIVSLYVKEARILGSRGGTRHELTTLLSVAANGRLRPVVHAEMPLADADKAHRIMDERKQFGKMILVPPE